MTKTNTLPFGSISSGTLRAEDLLPAFLAVADDLQLTRVERQSVREIRAEYDNLVEDSPYFTDGAAEEDVNTLIDILSNYCPPFAYFGAHPGDGADFGVWLSDDAFDHNGDVLKIDAGDARPKVADTSEDYLAEVTDHGNVTLYRKAGNRWREVWSLV